MTPNDPPIRPESGRRLSIVPCREGWAIKHGEGFLGVSSDREEALRLLEALQAAPERGASPPPR